MIVPPVLAAVAAKLLVVMDELLTVTEPEPAIMPIPLVVLNVPPFTVIPLVPEARTVPPDPVLEIVEDETSIPPAVEIARLQFVALTVEPLAMLTPASPSRVT